MNWKLTWMAVLGAITVAVVSATPHAGGWNDGSRLATVESLVDRRTWIIDDSVFVRPTTQQPHPYGPLAAQLANGTQDKLLIDGHFYSDKSPVPAVAMACSYQIGRWLGGPSAAERPDLFCWFMSLIWAGGAFVAAVLGIDRLARQARLSAGRRCLIVGSFALGTVALAYSRSVNNHIMLLAVTTWIVVFIDRLGGGFPKIHSVGRDPCNWKSPTIPMALGTLAGIAYTIDLGAGPVICLLTLMTAAVLLQSWNDVLLIGVMAAPWILSHHVLNYHIGGTLGPANANPEFFRWPGCPFNETNLTGGWPHRSIWAFAVYAVDMLIGKKGLFTHQPQLWLAMAAVIVLIRQRSARPALVFLTLGWCAGVWLLYAASSRNMSGQCVSVRWLVPLLAPAYYWLIQAVKFRPEVSSDFVILSVAGLVINIFNWHRGPWSGQTVALLWMVVAIAGAAWGWMAWQRRRRRFDHHLPMRQAA
jgi:hypothetical protein